MYHACNPPTSLAAFIEKFWLYEGQTFAHFKERSLPQGRLEVLINLHSDEIRVYDRTHYDQVQRFTGSIFRGAHSTFSIIDTAEQTAIMGIHFKVGGAAPFLPLPANELHNQHVDLKMLWGSKADRLYEALRATDSVERRFQLLSVALITHLENTRQIQHIAMPNIIKAVTQVPPTQTMQTIASGVGLSQRHFIQVFSEAVGLTPKLFCRVQRFQALLRSLEYGRPVHWAEAALDCGYYDQAHCIHDFQAFSGLTPSTYLASRGQFHNHVPL